MVKITKEESMYLRQHGVKEITRTSKQCSHRHTFYACEDKYILDLLNEFRKSQNVVETYGDV